jgi:hypothetical protein
MAREAGFETMITKGKIHGQNRDGDYTEEVNRLVALACADERKDIALLVEQMGIDGFGTLAIAAAIRARGNA